MHYKQETNNTQLKRSFSVSGANKNRAQEEPLGNTTVLSACPKPPVFQRPKSEAVDQKTGEVVSIELQKDGTFKNTFDRDSFRLKKYELQAMARKILPAEFDSDSISRKFRVKNCLRNVLKHDSSVRIYKSTDTGTCHYKGLMVCGSVWTCPVCAAKITEKKGKIITDIIEAHKKAGGNVLLVTLTVPHTRDDQLDFLLKRFKNAETSFSKTKAVMKIKNDIGFIEPIKSLEITYGHTNGWHPHSHQLWFIKNDVDLEFLKQTLFKQWKNYCLKRGLEAPSEQFGLDIRSGLKSGEYVSKMGWNASREIVKGHTKTAKNGRFAPFDLLDEVSKNNSSWAKEKFLEYAKATHGSHYISRISKLTKLYNIQDKSDEQLAHEEIEKSQLVTEIDKETWKKVLKLNQRASLLLIAEKLGQKGVKDFIYTLKYSPPP